MRHVSTAKICSDRQKNSVEMRLSLFGGADKAQRHGDKSRIA